MFIILYPVARVYFYFARGRPPTDKPD